MGKTRDIQGKSQTQLPSMRIKIKNRNISQSSVSYVSQNSPEFHIFMMYHNFSKLKNSTLSLFASEYLPQKYVL